MSKNIRIFILVLGLLLPAGLLCAQSGASSQPASSAASAQPADINSVSQAEPGKASAQAGEAQPAEKNAGQEEEEYSQFKYNSAVKFVAAKTGLSKQAVYWIFLIINFAILAAGLRWIVRKALPNGFAPRSAEIQKAIEEARKASAEASERLGEIEGRLARLDTVIAEIRAAAEADFSAEEQRIKAAAEQDAANVVAAAEQEIAAASRTAQRELKSFVADLAVNLAEQKIKVDEKTDQAFVRSFAAELGKDGQ
jgi:F-type H+-transporting ATPase subunit b